MNYDVVIFDLDGTLIDSIRDIGAAANHALALHGFPLRKEEEFPGLVGHGVRNLMKNAIPAELSQDDKLVDAVLADFTDFYTSNIDVFTRPYPGMHELLRELSGTGLALAVASNKFQSAVEYLVRVLFPDLEWIAIMGNKRGAPLKPNPAIVSEILDAICRKKKVTDPKAIFVGDSPADIRTAHNAGIPCIGVSWGYRDASELSEADLLVHSAEELRKLLLKPFNK